MSKSNGKPIDDVLPPSNLEAEKALLASLFALPEAIVRPEVARLLPGDFIDPDFRAIYRHLLGAYLDGNSPEVLPVRMTAAGELGDGTRAALVELMGTAVSGGDIVFYADEVRQAAEHRKLWTFGRELTQHVQDRLPPEDIYGFVERKLEERPAQKTGASKMSDQLPRHKGMRPPVLHGLLREGETLNIIAPPKTGKSWLTYELALSVVTGRRWLETFLPVPGRVLICDNELHPETLCDRIPRVAKAMGLADHEWTDQLETITLRGKLKDIHKLAADELGKITPGYYKLIVIDALYRVLPAECDENSNAAMAGVYNTIDNMAARLQCAFVAIHHSTKGSQAGKAVTDVGAGAGSISRAADTHFVLRAHEEQGAVVADGVTRSWAPIEPFCLRWDWPLWRRDDQLDPALLKPDRPRRQKKAEDKNGTEWTPEEKPWTAERFAERFVGDKPVAKLAIIDDACAAGLTQTTAEKLLKRAAAKKLIHPWRCPDDKRQVLFASVPELTVVQPEQGVAG